MNPLVWTLVRTSSVIPVHYPVEIASFKGFSHCVTVHMHLVAERYQRCQLMHNRGIIEARPIPDLTPQSGLFSSQFENIVTA